MKSMEKFLSRQIKHEKVKKREQKKEPIKGYSR
jgi:hypothetical protein